MHPCNYLSLSCGLTCKMLQISLCTYSLKDYTY
ncbi:hypothetical protein VPHF35G1_0062 [Vibrio phage F35 g1]|nr:hypothetical protein VP115E341_P0061 [Vibrio phage 115E34-1]